MKRSNISAAFSTIVLAGSAFAAPPAGPAKRFLRLTLGNVPITQITLATAEQCNFEHKRALDQDRKLAQNLAQGDTQFECVAADTNAQLPFEASTIDATTGWKYTLATNTLRNCEISMRTAMADSKRFTVLAACKQVRPIPSTVNEQKKPSENNTRFQMDSYSLEYPSTWKYQRIEQGGQTIHMFQGPSERDVAPYCQTKQQELAPSAPGAKMSKPQRMDFFSKNSDQKLLFKTLNTLPSAQGFRLVHMQPTIVGRDSPGYLADFFFRVPQGFVYRVRVHYTFWKKGIFMLWCAAAAKNEGSADEGFLTNLGTFQTIAASVQVRE